MPKPCRVCHSVKGIQQDGEKYICKYCGTEYTADEINEVPSSERKTIDVINKAVHAVCEVETHFTVNGEKSVSVATAWYIGNHRLVTNAHVALGDYDVYNSKVCDEIYGVFPYIDKNIRFKFIVDNVDQVNDIAILYIENDMLLKDHAIKFADNDNLVLGQTVYTIGNSKGKGLAPMEGMISMVNDDVIYRDYQQNEYPSEPVIRTTLHLLHGNSGGPLLNSKGEAIGVVSGGHCAIEHATVLDSNYNPQTMVTVSPMREHSFGRRLQLIKNLINNPVKYNGTEYRKVPEQPKCSNEWAKENVDEKILQALLEFEIQILPQFTTYGKDEFISLLEDDGRKLELVFKNYVKEVFKMDPNFVNEAFDAKIEKDAVSIISFPNYDEENLGVYALYIYNANLYAVITNGGMLLGFMNGKIYKQVDGVNPEDFKSILKILLS